MFVNKYCFFFSFVCWKLDHVCACTLTESHILHRLMPFRDGSFCSLKAWSCRSSVLTHLLVTRAHLDLIPSFHPELIPNAGLVSSGTRSRPPAGPRKPCPTPREPAPAPRRRPAGLANPRPTGARDADATQIGTSPSTRPSTPPGERRATSWTGKSGRGGITHQIVFV